MNEEKILDAIGDIDDDIIEEAERQSLKFEYELIKDNWVSAKFTKN